MFVVSYRDSRPVYEQIKEQALRMIITGVLKPGEKLQSVRELAAELVINPNTIQRAYRELENEGYIYTVPGKGCFVADEITANGVQLDSLLEQFDSCACKLLFGGKSVGELGKRLIELEKRIAEGQKETKTAEKENESEVDQA